MKKLFIHNPVFRILSPMFSGCLVYILILLIGNNVGQIFEAFFGIELFFCVFLSYLSHEFSRFTLLFFEKLKIKASYKSKLTLQVLSSILLIITLVSISVYLFYYLFVGYSPNSRELIIFNTIFVCIIGIYIALHLSHQFLFQINTQKLSEEFEKTDEIEQDFHQFRKGLNPTLLFESMESLIVLLQEGPEPAEKFIDQFATVYRYILSSDRKDLLPFKEEEKVLHTLMDLFSQLPFRKSQINIAPGIKTYVVPGTILFTLELIIRSSIASPKLSLDIHIAEKANYLEISYKKQEKLHAKLGKEELGDLQRAYTYYSDETVKVQDDGKNKRILFPILQAYNLPKEEIQIENRL